MKKLLITVLGPCALVGLGTIGIVWWDRGAPPGFDPTPVPVAFDALTRAHRGVRVKGTAHYAVRLKQKMEGGEMFTLFPLLAHEDVMGREIKVLVRTQRFPENLVTYENLVVDGLARPPGRLVGPEIREALEEGGYHFSDNYVLIETFEDWAPE